MKTHYFHVTVVASALASPAFASTGVDGLEKILKEAKFTIQYPFQFDLKPGYIFVIRKSKIKYPMTVCSNLFGGLPYEISDAQLVGPTVSSRITDISLAAKLVPGVVKSIDASAGLSSAGTTNSSIELGGLQILSLRQKFDDDGKITRPINTSCSEKNLAPYFKNGKGKALAEIYIIDRVATVRDVKYTFDHAAEKKASVEAALAKLFNLNLAASSKTATKTSLTFSQTAGKPALVVGVNARRLKSLDDASQTGKVKSSVAETEALAADLPSGFFSKKK